MRSFLILSNIAVDLIMIVSLKYEVVSSVITSVLIAW